MSKFSPAMKATVHAAATTPAPQAVVRGRGRPRGGKSGNRAQFQPLTVYIPRGTHRAVKSALVLEDRELSDLVGELLGEWLKRRGSRKS